MPGTVRPTLQSTKAFAWRVIVALAAGLGWHLHAMDVKTAFSNVHLLAYCYSGFWWKFCLQSSTRRLEVGSTWAAYCNYSRPGCLCCILNPLDPTLGVS